MKNRKLLATSYILLILLGIIFTFYHVGIAQAQGGSWLSGYSYRKSHLIGSTPNSGTGYQVRLITNYGSGVSTGINVYLDSHSQTKFCDIRFTASDGGTQLSYWMETYTASSSATFWVKITDNLSAAASTIYIYYGNVTAAAGLTTSSGTNTFLFFDDFSVENSTLWNYAYKNSVTYSYATKAGYLCLSSCTDNTWLISASSTGAQIKANWAVVANSSIMGTVMLDSSAAGNLMGQGGFGYGIASDVYGALNGIYDGDGVGKKAAIPYYSYIYNGQHNATDADLSGGTGISPTLFLRINALGANVTLWENSSKPTYPFKNFYTATVGGNLLTAVLYCCRYTTYALSTIYYDWIAIRNLCDQEPAQTTWGSEEAGVSFYAFQAPSIIYTDNYVFVNASITATSDITVVINVTLDLTVGSDEVILLWVNATNMFSVYYDKNTNCALNASQSIQTELNSTYFKLSWSVSFYSNMTEGYVSLNSLNTTISTSTLKVPASQSNWFYYEHDHTTVARFTFSPSNPLVNQNIQFNGTWSRITRVIISYSWVFSDGTTNTTSLEPVKSYSSANNYLVTLTVVTADYADQFSQYVNVTVVASTPYIVCRWFYNPQHPRVGDQIQFNGTLSMSSSTITSYVWTFQDGTTNITSLEPLKAYGAEGTYLVSLGVTSTAGSDTFSVNVTVDNHAYEVARFTFSPTNPNDTTSILFDASTSAAAPNPITAYNWTFGDGNVTIGNYQTIYHTYTDGVYDVILRIYTLDGNEDWTFNAINVSTHICPPNSHIEVEFIWSPNNPASGVVVSFDASQSNSSASITDYKWEFGDSNTTQGVYQTITHIYQGNGTYAIKLTITSTVGTVDITHPIVIGWGDNHTCTPTAHISVSFIWNPDNPDSGEEVAFDATSCNSSSAISNYEWDFGDSNVTSGNYVTITHTYGGNDTYLVTLEIMSSVGTASLTLPIVVGWGANHTCISVVFLSACFNFTPSNPANNSLVSFNGTYSNASSAITDWSWDFGDGNVTAGVYPTIDHPFTTDGTYLIKLTITTSDGTIDLWEPITVGGGGGGMTAFGYGVILFFIIVGILAVIGSAMYVRSKD